MPSHFSFSRRRGVRPIVKLVIYLLLSIALLVLDKRYEGVNHVKRYLATVMYPLQWLANKPVEIYDYFSKMWQSQDYLLNENKRLSVDNARLKLQERQNMLQLVELSELKNLVDLQHYGLKVRATAEILSSNKDGSSNLIAINKGSHHGIQTGDAVVDEGGLVGQVEQVQLLTAQVRLLTDSNMVVPVMVERTGIRTLIYGNGEELQLRYFPTDADLNPNDLLVTSGLDSVYPMGVPVAKIIQTSRNAGTPYYRVQLKAAATPNRSHYLLILEKQPEVKPITASATQASESSK